MTVAADVSLTQADHAARTSRLMCWLSMFAFTSLVVIDPYMVEQWTPAFLWVRFGLVVFGACCLGLPWTPIGVAHPARGPRRH